MGRDSEPDLGKPAVRDYPGGLRKRGHGGNVNPPRNRKGADGNLPPTAGAPELYPNPDVPILKEAKTEYERLK